MPLSVVGQAVRDDRWGVGEMEYPSQVTAKPGETILAIVAAPVLDDCKSTKLKMGGERLGD